MKVFQSVLLAHTHLLDEHPLTVVLVVHYGLHVLSKHLFKKTKEQLIN